MFKWVLLSLFLINIFETPLFALEISLSGAKKNFQNYSTLHIKDSEEFLCQEMKNDFDVVTQIVCAFSKPPTKQIKNLQNDFFKIETQMKNETYFIVITPFYKIKQYPIIFNLNQEDSVYQGNVKLSKHWIMVGYKDVLPYIKSEKNSDKAINFPYFSNKDMLPFVGGLDFDGKPVHITKVQDVTDYLKIKEAYKEKKYDLCLELINNIQAEYPNSLFNAELLFYKIKVNKELKRYDNVIELSKIYLREYSSDENIPEVLALVAKAYAIAGMNTDSDYFFDRLFSEHESSPYAKLGYIYKGETLEVSGITSKVSYYYEKALSESDDLDIAASAAYHLARFQITMSKKKEAAVHIMKLINAKPTVFMEELAMSMDMMYSLAEGEDFVTAAAMAKVILDKTEQKSDEYEKLLKDRGIWLSKTNKKQEALAVLNEYIQLLPEGSHIKEIETAKDSLFFDTSDSNTSARLIEYDALINTYKNDTIGTRATYEKAKLLLQNERYGDVLAFKDAILKLSRESYPDAPEIVKEAAIGVMKVSLKDKECHEVLNLSSDYNITLSNEWDDGIYECAMKGGDYLLSKKIASKNLKSKDLELRKKWLYRYIKVDFATGNYSDVVEASKELITLIQNDKNSEYKEVYRSLFDTYQRLEQNDKLVDAIVALEKAYGLDYKDIDRYVAMMSIGSKNKDDNVVIKYGTQVVNVQKKSNSFAQSPFVEFTLYQAYLNKGNFNSAFEIIKSLDTVELTNAKRARQKYLLGTSYGKLQKNEDAKKAYQEAIDADPSSSWAKLAKDAQKL
ncbi:MAG: flagellar protein [Campylobacterales bacterium]|nr:flagellar protein [Campylobacterales bacterium]